MKDVTSKPETLRSARAMSTIAVPEFCIPLVRERRTEKGDAIEAARFAATMAVKRTWELIPLCHPLPIQDVKVSFELGTDHIDTEVLVRAIANTGVEMEALAGASVAALTFYDMLKPHAGTRLSIGNVHLIEKLGGKSHYSRRIEPPVRGAVLVIDDDAAQRTAAAVCERLTTAGITCLAPHTVSLDAAALASYLRQEADHGTALITIVGATGVDASVPVEKTVRPLLDRELPGIIEAARNHAQRRAPYAMLEAGVSGLIGHSVVMTVPDDLRSAMGYLDALIPGIVHLVDSSRERVSR